MRRIGATLLSTCMAGCATTMTEDPAPAPVVDALSREETFAGLRGTDCGKFLPRATEIAGDPRFAADQAKEDQVVFLWQIANCAFDAKQYELAFRNAERATGLEPETPWLQVLRLYLGTDLDRADASLDALQVLSRISPESVREIELRHLSGLLRDARDLDKTGDQELAAYEALVRAAYEPAAPYFDDFLRMGHGRILLERGRTDEAFERLRTIVDIRSIVEMRVERLFEPLRTNSDFAAQLDIPKAVKLDVARSRAAMEANTDLMEGVYLHAGVLDAAKREAEGLAITESALARYATNEKSFRDADEFRNWLLNTRGYLLYALGRNDDGRAALAEAAGLQEDGQVNVSNIINLAGYLIMENRASEALELLPRIGKPSPYGQGWIESIRSCAGAQMKDEAQRTAGLEYLKAHESDNPAALSRALLCSNDLNGAAALMIRRLADRDMRTDALLSLQKAAPANDEALPYRDLLVERFDLLRERPDVRAAVERVGRIESIPVDVGGEP